MQEKCKWLTSIVFGTVHSDRTVVVLIHKHFSSSLSTFHSISIIIKCKYATMSESNITAYVNNWFTFMSNFSSILLTVFCRFFTWIALSDVDLRFLLMLVTEANAVEKATTWAACLHHQRNQSIHVTDGVTVMTLSASVLQKTSAAMDCLWQIALNQNYNVHSKSGVNSQVALKLNNTKRNCLKWDLPVYHLLVYPHIVNLTRKNINTIKKGTQAVKWYWDWHKSKYRKYHVYVHFSWPECRHHHNIKMANTFIKQCDNMWICQKQNCIHAGIQSRINSRNDTDWSRIFFPSNMWRLNTQFGYWDKDAEENIWKLQKNALLGSS